VGGGDGVTTGGGGAAAGGGGGDSVGAGVGLCVCVYVFAMNQLAEGNEMCVFELQLAAMRGPCHDAYAYLGVLAGGGAGATGVGAA
jgi:hypothetical protein